MYLPAKFADCVAKELREYISKPLKHDQEDSWDLHYFQVKYKGQKIEVGGSPGAKFLDSKSGDWVEQTIHFDRSVEREFDPAQLRAEMK